MFQLNLFLIALAFHLVSKAQSAKILCLFPFPFKSHQIVYQPLTQELARRGHEVTIFTTHPAFPKGQTPEKIIEIDIHATDGVRQHVDTEIRSLTQAKTLFADALKLQTAFDEAFKIQLKYIKEASANYSSDHFDLLFLESGFKSLIGFSHVFKAPVIRISPIGAQYSDYSETGMATHPFLYPNMNQQRIYNLTLWEKVTELLYYFDRELLMMPKMEELEINQIKLVFGDNVPPLRELSNNVEMLFLQTHPLWTGNEPVAPNVVHIWGIHHKPTKPLPTDVKNLLDGSTNGVIYMSFGSIMKASWMPNNTIQAITRALSRVPYDVFLKWEEDVLPEKPRNVHIRKWWPQADLLKHSQVKLFVSHGGLMSVNEAIVAGVPLVNIPIFGDHFYNAEKCVHHKIGVKLELESITENQLFNAINIVVEDKIYRHNIIKLRSLMMDQPESPLDRAVWWTEYVLRHSGARHLRSPAANISWAQYYEMELVFTIISGIILMSFLIFLAVYLCLKCLIKFWAKNYSKSNCHETNVKND